jgi:hypothetical protein
MSQCDEAAQTTCNAGMIGLINTLGVNMFLIDERVRYQCLASTSA